MKKFELNDAQDDRLARWAKKHRAENHLNGAPEVTGAWLKFSFIPNGLGDNAKAWCIWCGESVNLAIDGDTGEFIEEWHE